MISEMLCMGCMEDTNQRYVCPLCGYRNGREAESSLHLSPRTVLQGKYLVGRVLGQGGFGITYMGYDLEANRKLVIKEYFPSAISTRAPDRITVNPLNHRNRSDLEFGLKMFAEEGSALARFKDHPGMVSILDFFYANGTGYLVMAYLEGCTLKEYLSRQGEKIHFSDALRILNPVMDTLDDLHRMSILHLDVSPDNIYVEQTGGVKVLDFGATRHAMGAQSRSLSVVFKPGYAPLEQYRSRGTLGAWTDVYSVAATIYRCITGLVPMEATDRMGHDELVPPSRLGVYIPPNSEAALMKALAVKVEERYQTITEFREGLTSSQYALAPIHLSKKVFLPIVFLLLLAILISEIEGSFAGAVLISSVVVLFGMMMVLLFYMWRPIQDGHARTTPFKAVAFCFIPVFNLYWAFPVLWGFSKDYNRFVDRHSIDTKNLNEMLFLCCSLVSAGGCFFIPLGGLPAELLTVANAALLLPVAAIICDAVNALRTAKPKKPVAVNGLSVYCVTGEYQGETLEIGSRDIVIGRNPTLANLVLSSREVSAKHLRIWLDPARSGVWIEDLRSPNGTFYRTAASSDDATAWIPLTGGRMLSVGDRFRLGGDAAEFEVKGSGM
jgi:serine/threonine protein kinase